MLRTLRITGKKFSSKGGGQRGRGFQLEKLKHPFSHVIPHLEGLSTRQHQSGVKKSKCPEILKLIIQLSVVPYTIHSYIFLKTYLKDEYVCPIRCCMS